MARKGRARPTEKRAHGRSLSDFGRLWPAEKLLLEAARVGEIAVIAETRPEARTGENVVRAAFLRFLLLGGDAQAPVHELGAQLQGAWVEGPLNLTYATTTSAVRCERCHFDHPIVMWYARVRGLFCLIGSFVPGIQGDHFRCDGPMYFRDGFESKGSIRLPSAQIGGSLEFDGAKLDGLGDHALHANSIEIRGDVFLNQGFETVGLVSLLLAKIEGVLECSDSKLDGTGQRALLAIQAAISGGVYLGEKMQAVGAIVFESARVGGDFQVSNCNLNGEGKAALYADCIVIDGSFSVDGNTEVVGSVCLREAQIEGQLRLGEAALDGQDGAALLAGDAKFSGGVIIQEGLEVFGSMLFSNTTIGSNFIWNRSVIDGKGSRSIIAENVKVHGGLVFLNGFHSIGEMLFSGAKIDGGLVFRGAILDGTETCSAQFNQAEIVGSLYFGDESVAVGTFVISYAKIVSGEFYRGKISGKDAYAIMSFCTNFSGSLFFGDEFVAEGLVDLSNACIGGDLRFKKSLFCGDGEHALLARRAVINGSVMFFDGFYARAAVSLSTARIHGDLSCCDAKFENHKSKALDANGAEIRSVFLTAGFEAKGATYFIGAKIALDFTCEEASLDVDADFPLAATNMQVSNRLIFRNLQSPVPRVWLSAASAGLFCDDASAWGEGLVLNNFTYGSITGGSPTTARERIAWLDKQLPADSGLAGSSSDFRPQPWRQLQKVLREMGHAEDARQVAIAFEHRMRRAGVIGQSQDTLRPWLLWTNRPRRWLYRKVACFFHWWFWVLTGYGYRPMRLMIWMLAVWLGCAAFYWTMALPPRDVFAPSSPLVFQASFYRPCLPCEQIREATPSSQSAAVTACLTAQAQMHEELRRDGKRFYPGNWYLCPRVREEYTGFSPLAYSLDVILPLVDLQQQKDWGAMIPTPEPGVVSELGTLTWKHLTRFIVWFETLFGWLASLLLVAIVSGLTKRRED